MSEHTEVAAYALGLLEPDEMTVFEAHLAGCDTCAVQLEWMLSVSDDLADVEPGDLYGVAGPSAFARPEPAPRPFSVVESPTPYPAPAPSAPLTHEQPTSYQQPAAPPPPIRSLRAAPPPPPTPATGIPPLDPTPTPTPTPPPAAAPDRPGVGRESYLYEPAPYQPGPPEGDRTARRRAPEPPPYEAGPEVVDDRDGGRGHRRAAPQGYDDESRRRSSTRSPGRPPTDRFGPSRTRGHGLALASAAAVIGVLAGIGAMTALPDGGTGDRLGVALPETSSDRVAATDARTGVHADVAMDPKAWGTLVSFGVSDIDGPRVCQLVAVRKDGVTEVLSSWAVPEQGYDDNSTPRELQLVAATATRRADIEELQVQDVGPNGATTLVRLSI